MAFGADDPKVGFAKTIATNCNGVTADDRCEAAAKSYACSIDEAHKLGIKFSDLGL